MRRIGLVAAVAAFMAVACSGGGGIGGDGGSGGEIGAPQEVAPGGGGAAADVAGLPPLGPAVIKTADLELEVPEDGFGSAIQEAMAIAERHGGFVVSSTVGGTEVRSGSLVLRVPAERFGSAMDGLRALGEVRAQSISGKDVTQEFVDLGSRLRNLEAQESVLLRLMDRATSIADSIRVQNVLQDVQLQVERIEGRVRFLEDQTALSTITARLVEEGAAFAEPTSTFGRAWNEAVDGFLSVIAAGIVAVGYLLPFVAMGLVALVLVRRVRSRPGGAPSG
jgi:Domain of unknown function (DUF4349)